MPQLTGDIKRRIKSVASTKKITKAMELVSASKMRRAVERVLASRQYSDLAWKLVMNLAKRVDQEIHPLLQERSVKKVGILVIGSNRGLCGGFNISVVDKVRQLIRKEGWDQNVDVDLITFGKRAAQGLAALKLPVAADYPKDDITREIAEILPLSQHLIRGFIDQQYDEVAVVYTHFHSSLKQETRVRHLLPLVKPSRFLGHGGNETIVAPTRVHFSEYLFEPTMDQVLDAALLRLVEVQMYQMVLESEASEHSARMMAMRNASDAAREMIDDLTLVFNRVRQASITAEIAEISAGAEGLSGR
ncbi:MAG: ATP synthase F1 subunit gamma [Candidatus Komeilibacteria bacterium]